MPAPVASGWSIAGWAFHPLESAAFARRTPLPDAHPPIFLLRQDTFRFCIRDVHDWWVTAAVLILAPRSDKEPGELRFLFPLRELKRLPRQHRGNAPCFQSLCAQAKSGPRGDCRLPYR